MIIYVKEKIFNMKWNDYDMATNVKRWEMCDSTRWYKCLRVAKETDGLLKFDILELQDIGVCVLLIIFFNLNYNNNTVLPYNYNASSWFQYYSAVLNTVFA